MAFDDILRGGSALGGYKGIQVPSGATERYLLLEGLERQLRGTFYADLPYGFEQEKDQSGNHVPLRHRRPSIIYNLASLIVSDTQAELFGDEQFPIVKALVNGEANDEAGKAVAELLLETELPDVVFDAYSDGCVGSVAVTVSRSGNGLPFYEVIPGKWCEPVYESDTSTELAALKVTYPIDRAEVASRWPAVIAADKTNDEIWWWRYILGPSAKTECVPLPSVQYVLLGKPDPKKGGEIVAFAIDNAKPHGFNCVPAVFATNLGGKSRRGKREPWLKELAPWDGPALWWPIVDGMVDLDYTFSQESRGLRYAADPMLFLKVGNLFGEFGTGVDPFGGEGQAERTTSRMSTTLGADGSTVRGVTQTLVGMGDHSDAKLLEIGAAGLREEREFANDLREHLIEIVGGQKASAEHTKGVSSGKALHRLEKPLGRLVRRQRRPYGDGLFLGLLELTLEGIRSGALKVATSVTAIPEDAKLVNDWPAEEILEGSELLAHVTAKQLAAGGSAINPKELVKAEVMGASLASDMGLHAPYDTIKGDLEPLAPPPDPNAAPEPGTPPKPPGKVNPKK